jgi:hypothetical protein
MTGAPRDDHGVDAADHPLAAVAALAAKRGGPALELLARDHGRLLVRLRCARPPLWVMMADEDGSVWDKWTSDVPAIRFVKIPRELAARGAAAMLALIETAAARETGDDQ